MIEAKFGFLQMEKKGVCGDAVELRQTTFGEAPETLDAIDMVLTHGKLMSLVIHPEMFLISHVDQSVVAGPAVGVDDGFQADAARNGLPQRLSATVGDDLGVDRTVALEDAEDDGLAGGAAAPFTTNAARTEVALVDLDLAEKRGRLFAVQRDDLAQTNKTSPYYCSRHPARLPSAPSSLPQNARSIAAAAPSSTGSSGYGHHP